MKKIKFYLKYIAYTSLSIFLSLLILTTMYYFNILSTNIINYLRPFIVLLNIFISSYIIGKKSEKNGYLEGIKFGIFMLFIFMFISLLFFKEGIKPRIIIYDFIIIGISMFGSMLGISKEKKN